MLNHLFDRHPEVANFPTEANDLWHPLHYPWHESRGDAPPFFVDGKTYTDTSLAARLPKHDVRLRATFGAYQVLERKPVFLHKTVMVTFMLDHVLELFPDARIIQLVRDGRAVAVSLVDKERKKLKHPAYAMRGHAYEEDKLLDIFIQHWQDHVLAMESAVSKHRLAEQGRYHEVSYEALCASPGATLGRLATFMGISTDCFEQSDLSFIRNANAKARERLSAERVAQLSRLAAEGLALKSYGAEIL
jgi:hypothetical protein